MVICDGLEWHRGAREHLTLVLTARVHKDGDGGGENGTTIAHGSSVTRVFLFGPASFPLEKRLECGFMTGVLSEKRDRTDPYACLALPQIHRSWASWSMMKAETTL